VNLNEVEAVKLYYSGTEAPQRAGQLHYSPVQQYVSSHAQGKTRCANPSYSLKVEEVIAPVSEVIFSPDYKLFPGINYFWVSLQMIPNASLLSDHRCGVDLGEAGRARGAAGVCHGKGNASDGHRRAPCR